MVFLICFWFFTNNISFWESWTNSSKQVTESLRLEDKFSNKVNDIAFYFCNDWLELKKLTTSLEINMRPGEEKEICTVFANKSDAPMEIIEWFTNWRLDKPNDKFSSILCDVDITWKNKFSELVTTPYDYNLSLSGKELEVKKVSIKIPKNQTGAIYLCRMFKIKWNLQLAKSWSMFNIEVVKKMPIQINITWDTYNNSLLANLKWTISESTNIIIKIAIWAIWLRLIAVIVSTTHRKKKHKH